ncbi:uncharacterized protein DUF4231 [Streptomyces sp. TLI_55]|uniref:DUF4231 domain-containing protein n=1 Tax=Streptomyces sp. TLI_55 TaxID=1938861 RepID=UPI000BD797CD|nr:DUF4231 domain-containing protein [Streptomyces sp. TLI_55]SNX57578.1 uncharacterized protein DUF4231 [Streptomyces sp. TLI_55]
MLPQSPPEGPDLPGVFESADAISVEGQRDYLKWTRGRLQLALAAALFGGIAAAVDRHGAVERTAAALALTAFIAALLTEVHLLRNKPEERWYTGRALAESVKTLAWRYMAGAAPFPPSLGDDDAREVMLTRIHDLTTEANLPGLTFGQVQVTDRMREIRDLDFAGRKSAYLTRRVADQEAWYEKKARFNKQNSGKWRTILIVFEVLGVAVSTVSLLDIADVDAGGVVAAAVAAAGAWLEVKQYDNLASAYSLTATELGFVRMTGENVTAEADWSRYVVSAEQAISREHTMWLARRLGMRAVRMNPE